MRILAVNKFLHPRGGAEQVFFQETGMLEERGHEVAAFGMDHPDNPASAWSRHFPPARDYDAPGGIFATLRTAATFIHSPGAVAGIMAMAREFKPDLAHLHNVYHQLTPSIIPALKSLGVPVVLTLHDYKPFCPAYSRLDGHGRPCSRCVGGHPANALFHGCGGSRTRGALLALESWFHRLRRSWRGVDLFIAPSRFMADTALAHGVPESRLAVLNNGVDPKAFAPSGRDHGHLLYLGRLSREKGLDVLMAAWNKIGQGRKLVVAGDGPLMPELKSMDLPGVRLAGHVRGRELAALLDGARAVAVPSQWYENFSLSVLEAMAMAKPVLATRMGGLPEQVEHGQTGFLSAPGDPDALARHMKALLDDPVKAREMGRAGRDKVQKEYTLARHMDGLEAIYRRALNNWGANDPGTNDTDMDNRAIKDGP